MRGPDGLCVEGCTCQQCEIGNRPTAAMRLLAARAMAAQEAARARIGKRDARELARAEARRENWRRAQEYQRRCDAVKVPTPQELDDLKESFKRGDFRR